jgi:hypothetical protein
LLEREENIVWVRDIGPLGYVRESTIRHHRRAGKISRRYYSGILIGYSELKANAASNMGMFERRVFWLSYHDCGMYADFGVYAGSGCPAEAVDPMTVKPQVAGLRGRRVLRDKSYRSMDCLASDCKRLLEEYRRRGVEWECRDCGGDGLEVVVTVADQASVKRSAILRGAQVCWEAAHFIMEMVRFLNEELHDDVSEFMRGELLDHATPLRRTVK